MTTQLIDCIGNTPLIRLNRLSDETGCEILGKAEFMNPGGSVKERIAVSMIDAAEEQGLLRPGGTIIEVSHRLVAIVPAGDRQPGATHCHVVPRRRLNRRAMRHQVFPQYGQLRLCPGPGHGET